MLEAAQPLSEGVQIGIRLPVILVALAGVVLALVMMRRIGVAAGILGAAGSLFFAVDQLVNIVWVLHIASLVKSSDTSADEITTVSNTYTLADCALMTIGVILVVASFAFRRSAPPPAAPAGQFPANPYATPQPPTFPPASPYQDPYQAQQPAPPQQPPFPPAPPEQPPTSPYQRP
jgi:hypothetical protein